MISLDRFLSHFLPLFDEPRNIDDVLRYGAEQHALLMDGVRDGSICDNAVSAWLESCREVDAFPGF